MLAGVTLALERRPLAGIVVCALAATVKLPAAAAIPFIAVTWARTQPTPGARAAVLARAAAAVLVVALLVSAIPGIGFSWLSGALFSTPQKVRLAITPATALGWTGAAVLRDLGVSVERPRAGGGAGPDRVLRRRRRRPRAAGAHAARADAARPRLAAARGGVLRPRGVALVLHLGAGPARRLSGRAADSSHRARGRPLGVPGQAERRAGAAARRARRRFWRCTPPGRGTRSAASAAAAASKYPGSRSSSHDRGSRARRSGPRAGGGAGRAVGRSSPGPRRSPPCSC